MKGVRETKILNQLYGLLVILFFVGFMLSIRPLVGLTTILLAASALLIWRLEKGKWWNPALFNLFVIGLFLYFAMQAIALLYTRNLRQGFSIFQTNLGMVVLPVGVLYSGLVNRRSFRQWMKIYTYILLAASGLALGYAAVSFLQKRDVSVFFYHQLLHLYSGHAIQFSVIVFVGILFLIEEYSSPSVFKNKGWIIGLIIYFSFFLVLLSSKLVIIFYFLYILYLVAFTEIFIRWRIYRFAGLFALLALMAGIFLIASPFSRRIKEEVNARVSLIREQRYNPGDYFTGVQFRLLSWRFVYEILNEKHAWLLGVSPGDSQGVLAEKYRKENMFVGGMPENKRGYLDYHSHNQFLQAVLETGIFGLMFFLIACAGLIRMAWKSADRSCWALALLLLCNCFTDAPLKTQYGIILFVFFPLLLYYGSREEAPAV
jgi:O-antigen ligase